MSAGVRAVVGMRSGLSDADLLRAGCNATLKDWSELTPTFFFEQLAVGPKVALAPSAALAEIDSLRDVLSKKVGKLSDEEKVVPSKPLSSKAADEDDTASLISMEGGAGAREEAEVRLLDESPQEALALLRAEVARLSARNTVLEASLSAVRNAVQTVPALRDEEQDLASFCPISCVVPLGGSRSALRPLLKIIGKESILWVLESLQLARPAPSPSPHFVPGLPHVYFIYNLPSL